MSNNGHWVAPPKPGLFGKYPFLFLNSQNLEVVKLDFTSVTRTGIEHLSSGCKQLRFISLEMTSVEDNDMSELFPHLIQDRDTWFLK